MLAWHETSWAASTWIGTEVMHGSRSLFELACRINHSCLPNCRYVCVVSYWQPALLLIQLLTATIAIDSTLLAANIAIDSTLLTANNAIDSTLWTANIDIHSKLIDSQYGYWFNTISSQYCYELVMWLDTAVLTVIIAIGHVIQHCIGSQSCYWLCDPTLFRGDGARLKLK